MSEQRLEGFAKVKAATPFNASEQERRDTLHKNYYRYLILFTFSFYCDVKRIASRGWSSARRRGA